MAAAAAEPELRVVLVEHASTVRMASPELGGAGERRIEPGPAGLRVDGIRKGRSLRLAPPGPHRVEGRRYRGAMEMRLEQGQVVVVNEVPVESYVAGVLLGEVYERWGAAVLRAQAVVARTYALHRRARARAAGRRFDLEGDTAGQVYLGLDGESPAARAAVEATRGVVLEWEGEPILAAFHSCSGGQTASAEEVWGERLPYLQSVRVEGEEDSPDMYWRVRLTTSDLRRALARLGQAPGAVRDLRVVERSPSGRVRRVRVLGSEGSVEVQGRDFRRALGLARVPSTLFEVRREGEVFLLVGSGRGHGVGMSQWGALALAHRGSGPREILATFYPGAVLQPGYGHPTSDRTALGAVRAEEVR